MAKIGVFWWGDDRVIGNARALSEGEYSVAHIIDSPDTHVELWEQQPDLIQLSQALRELDYQDVPRGRVVYDRKAKQSIVYLDKRLMNSETKTAICAFFALKAKQTKWRKDPHYTVDPYEIERLWED